MVLFRKLRLQWPPFVCQLLNYNVKRLNHPYFIGLTRRQTYPLASCGCRGKENATNHEELTTAHRSKCLPLTQNPFGKKIAIGLERIANSRWGEHCYIIMMCYLVRMPERCKSWPRKALIFQGSYNYYYWHNVDKSGNRYVPNIYFMYPKKKHSEIYV